MFGAPLVARGPQAATYVCLCLGPALAMGSRRMCGQVPEGYSINQAKRKARQISLSLSTFSSVPLTRRFANHGNLSDQTNLVRGTLMVCSRCLGLQPYELQVGKSPSFLAAFHRCMPPFGQNLESIQSSVRQTKTKMAAPVKRFFSLYLYHVGHFNINFKCSHT